MWQKSIGYKVGRLIKSFGDVLDTTTYRPIRTKRGASYMWYSSYGLGGDGR